MAFRGGDVVARGALALAAAVVIVLSFGATARAAEPKPVPPSFPNVVHAEPLHLEAVGPRAVMVSVASGYCSGDPYRPAIARVRVRWKRMPNDRFRAVLTALIREPTYEPVVDPDPNDNVVYNACAKLRLQLKHRVVLPRPLAGIHFFDGSQTPPRRIAVASFLTR